MWGPAVTASISRTAAIVLTLACGVLAPALSAAQEDPPAVFRQQLSAPLLLSPSGGGPGQPATIEIVTTGTSLRKDVPFSVPLAANGGVPGYTWEVGPNGLGAVASGDRLVGTPVSNGTHDVEVVVTDSSGTEGRRVLAFEVTSPMVTFPQQSVTGSFGAPFSYAPTYEGLVGSGDPAFSLQGAPNGLSISEDGVVSGTIASAGTFTPVIVVTDADGSTSPPASFSLVVQPAVPVSNSYLSSVTGGNLLGISDRRQVVTTSLPTTSGILLSPGGSVTATYDRPVQANELRWQIRVQWPSSECFPDGVGIGDYKVRTEYSVDGVTWFLAQMAEAVGGKRCSISGSQLPPAAANFKAVRFTLDVAKSSSTGGNMSLLLNRLSPL